jgi:trehalose 6-phosphate phosphatase
MALLQDALAPLRLDPSGSAVLLDIDGTLSPIVDNAADASVPEATRQLLIAISRRFALVACISGRRASEARAMVSIGTISYVGAHGAEMLMAGWTEAVLDPALAAWMEPMRELARKEDSTELRRARVRLEDKGAIIAFHWRGAHDEQAAKGLIDAVAARALAAGLHVHWGRKVMEVRPPVRIDKGDAVIGLIRRSGVRAAIYVGDDNTDLDAFRALLKLTESGELQYGLRVGVRSNDGPRELEAATDLVVDGTEGVQQLLASLAAEQPT